MTQKQPQCSYARAKNGLHGGQTSLTIDGEDNPQGDIGFRFGRMLPRAYFQPLILKDSFAKVLGQEMVKPMSNDDGPIPSGYTYFGQFVDHDITRDTTRANAESDQGGTDAIEPTLDEDLIQSRSPSLDLDSLYGHPVHRDETLFQNDRASFLIGRSLSSEGEGNSGKNLANDLLRKRDVQTGHRGTIHVNGQDMASGRRAHIPDPRNDENLIVGQHHLMMQLFHNAVVKTLRNSDPSRNSLLIYDQARELVTLHYQHIVLHDFVRRIINESVYEDVIVDHKRKLLGSGIGELPFMPLEFSVAAYRMGHSMVRPTYEWNLNFSTGGHIIPFPAEFNFMFQFSGLSGTLTPDNSPGNALPSNWVADFRRLYDLGQYNPAHLEGASEVEKPDLAKKIDPYLAPELAMLPGDSGENLAYLNLRRGSMRGLPSAQDFAKYLYAKKTSKLLTRAQMEKVFAEDPGFHAVMDQHGFYDRTPLWLYLLIEAKAQQDGNSLGDIGSQILAETFLTLVKGSRISLYNGHKTWHPNDAIDTLQADAAIETIADMLIWIDQRIPIVNPLEDNRL